MRGVSDTSVRHTFFSLHIPDMVKGQEEERCALHDLLQRVFLGRQSIMVNFASVQTIGVLPPGLSGQRRMKRESGARPGQTRCRKLHRELPLTLYSPLLPSRQWEGCEGREQAGRPAIVSRVKCFRGKEPCLSRNQPTHCRIYAIAAPAIHPTLSPGDHDS